MTLLSALAEETMAQDKAKPREGAPRDRVSLYLSPEKKQALVERALKESVKVGRRISVTALVELWIDERLKGGRS